MTSKKIDHLLISLGLMLIIFSSYQLFLWQTNFQTEGLTLATLEDARSVVKIKSFSSLDWRDAFSGSMVGEKQLIYTDTGSSADIKFLKGHKVSVSENSLIRVSSLAGTGNINLERGLIRAKIQGKEPFLIKMNGSTVKLTSENADVQIRIQGGAGEIGVFSGEVSVEKEGQLETIDPTKALKVEGQKLIKQDISFTLLEPKPDEILYTTSTSEKVLFKWDPGEAGEVLVANNPSLKKAKVFRGIGTASAELTPGTYYWKVEDDSGSSIARAFRLSQESPLEVLRPLDGEKILLAQEEKRANEVFLQWRGQANDTYLVEWTDHETHFQKSKGLGLAIPVPKSGILNWRVKVDSADRPLAQWSNWQSIDVTLIQYPKVPSGLEPQQLELQTYSKGEESVELKWSSETKTELEVLDPKNSRTYLLVEDNNYLLKLKEPGLYRWRVRSRDEFKRLSPWTEWSEISLVDLSHETSQEGFQRIQLKKPDQSVTFNWKSEAGASTVFELSDSKDFSDIIIKKEVPGSEINVVVPDVGDYYWRSRRSNPDGTFTVSEPKKVIIEKAPAPAKPEKLPDLKVPLEWEETTHVRHWWDLFIASAYADDPAGLAKIELPVKEEAKQYVIRIFSDPSGTQLVHEAFTETKVFTWKHALAGEYYWQYALVDYWGRQSPFSDLSILTVTNLEPLPPVKPYLKTRYQGKEVEGAEIELDWTHNERNKNFLVEVASDPKFEKIFFQKESKKSALTLRDHALTPGRYFWRVVAMNESQKKTFSPVDEFIILPPVERIQIVDKAPEERKVHRNKVSISWAPSLDTFTFKEGEKEGEIEGSPLNAVEAKGRYSKGSFLLSGDVLRQSGKVFESKEYLFQRFQLHGSWVKPLNDHLWGVGLSAGTVSGYTYSIKAGEVEAESLSGLIYGPHLLGTYTVTPLWELHGKISYLVGAIPQAEAFFEAHRKIHTYFLVLGLGYASRSYEKNDGSQSSLRSNLGLGKEF